MKIGQTIYHPRFGPCELQQIDNKTYSIPMVVVAVKENIESIPAGQPICRAMGEFSEKEL
jgi:hypothetical protein